MRLLTLKSLLVAVDPEDPSLAAMRAAGQLASLTGASLHLLHVSDHEGPSVAAELVGRFRAVAGESAEPASARVATGSAAAAIVDEARKVRADVVILGPHRHGRGEATLGSTAAEVVRTAPCPCLVISTDARVPLERVLASIDATPAAAGVLSVALSWASALRPRGVDVRVTVLHVGDGAAEGQVSDEIEAARSRAGGAQHVELVPKIVAGSQPAEEILRAVEADGVDLLVMGTRGAQHEMNSLGSVSAAVVRAAPCPLLLVPPEVWTAQRDDHPAAPAEPN